MIELLSYFISASLASMAFGLVFALRSKTLLFGAFGGGMGWVIYNVLDKNYSYAFAFFIAAVMISIYSEVMARVQKMPASVFILVGMLPLVPGEGIYLTMASLVNEDYLAFKIHGRETFVSAGVLALAILLVSSMARLYSQIKLRRSIGRKTGS